MMQIVRGRACFILLLMATVAALSACDSDHSVSTKPAAKARPTPPLNARIPATKPALAASRPTTQITPSTTRASKIDGPIDINAPENPVVEPVKSPTTKKSAPRWSGEHFSIVLPEGWKGIDGAPPRIGTFMTGTGLQVAVLIFDGDAGGTLGNANLWRRQVGLTPVGEAQMRESMKRIEGDNGPFTVVDLVGPTQRMLAAVLPQSDRTVFLKMSGPIATVEREHNAFVEAAKSFKVK